MPLRADATGQGDRRLRLASTDFEANKIKYPLTNAPVRIKILLKALRRYGERGKIMSDSNGKSTNLKQKIKELPQAIKVFWKTPPKGRYLNLKEILCFSGSAFGMSTVVTVVSGLITATQIPTIYNFNVIHGAWICLISTKIKSNHFFLIVVQFL